MAPVAWRARSGRAASSSSSSNIIIIIIGLALVLSDENGRRVEATQRTLSEGRAKKKKKEKTC